MSYVKPKDAALFYNVSEKTLRVWENNGQIIAQKTNGGHRRYLIDNKKIPLYLVIKQTINNPSSYKKDQPFIIYARVSSHKQKSDLQNQVNFLINHFNQNNKDSGEQNQSCQNKEFQIITDIGGGLNWNRPGFKSILERLFNRSLQQVLVAYPDRWSRFGFDFFQWIFQVHGAQLISINHQTSEEPASELSKDIIAVITHFTAKYHGARKYHMRQKDSDLSESDSETNV